MWETTSGTNLLLNIKNVSGRLVNFGAVSDLPIDGLERAGPRALGKLPLFHSLVGHCWVPPSVDGPFSVGGGAEGCRM